MKERNQPGWPVALWPCVTASGLRRREKEKELRTRMVRGPPLHRESPRWHTFGVQREERGKEKRKERKNCPGKGRRGNDQRCRPQPRAQLGRRRRLTRRRKGENCEHEWVGRGHSNQNQIRDPRPSQGEGRGGKKDFPESNRGGNLGENVFYSARGRFSVIAITTVPALQGTGKKKEKERKKQREQAAKFARIFGAFLVRAEGNEEGGKGSLPLTGKAACASRASSKKVPLTLSSGRTDPRGRSF